MTTSISGRYLDNMDGLTSADESRPMSAADLLTSGGVSGITDASSWIAAGSVTLRRNAASRATRPLTRYLPVTGQENFDLRAHIESAGHQVKINVLSMFRIRNQFLIQGSSGFGIRIQGFKKC